MITNANFSIFCYADIKLSQAYIQHFITATWTIYWLIFLLNASMVANYELWLRKPWKKIQFSLNKLTNLSDLLPANAFCKQTSGSWQIYSQHLPSDTFSNVFSIQTCIFYLRQINVRKNHASKRIFRTIMVEY